MLPCALERVDDLRRDVDAFSRPPEEDEDKEAGRGDSEAGLVGRL